MRSHRGVTKLGCLLLLLVVAAVAYLGTPAAEAYMRYLKYKDAMDQELRFRGELADDALRTRFRDIVDSLSLPPEAAEVTITRNADGIVVRATYEEFVPLPGTEWRLVFEPRAERR